MLQAFRRTSDIAGRNCAETAGSTIIWLPLQELPHACVPCTFTPCLHMHGAKEKKTAVPCYYTRFNPILGDWHGGLGRRRRKNCSGAPSVHFLPWEWDRPTRPGNATAWWSDAWCLRLRARIVTVPLSGQVMSYIYIYSRLGNCKLQDTIARWRILSSTSISRTGDEMTSRPGAIASCCRWEIGQGGAMPPS
jgi:hypothetical protein